MDTRDKPVSVSELNALMRGLIETGIGLVWVEGEISNFKPHSSGHLYFSLKDEKSQIRAVMFKGSALRLAFRPEDGQSVLVRGRVSMYEARGEVQIVVDRMEPLGVGSLQLAFLQLKEKLEKEGLFDPGRKRPIPAMPRRVGVVTSPTGAAIRDFLNVARRRFANISVLIAPASVQGEAAPAEVAEAIETLNAIAGIDAIVVTRGGGSIEDLWAFNTEIVARSIHASRIPVISAVGHEVDFTIADFVADLRAPTPSAAAELLIRHKETQVYQIASLRIRLERSIRSVLAERRARVTAEFRSLPDVSRMIRDRSQRVDDLHARLVAGVRSITALMKARLSGVQSRLSTLNPLATLGRGYSLVTRHVDGRLVTEAGQVGEGDRVDIRLRRGSLICEVLESKEQLGLFPDDVGPGSETAPS